MEKTLFVWLLLVTLMITIPGFAAPPSAPTPVGIGSGDFSGPASATDGNFVSFDGVGGKTGKDSGSKATDFLGASAKAADADKLDNHDSTYFQVDLGLVKGTMTDGKYCTYTASGTVLNCNSDGGSITPGTAYQMYHTNSGATAGEWTSTLGSSSTRLTMGYFTNLEITNSPTVNGTALSALYQPLDSTLTGLAGIAITVDGNNVTFPGAIITTAENGSRKLAVLANTVGVDATSDAFELYPDSDDLWKLNQHGTEYTFVLNGLASGGLLFGDSTPDAAGEIAYDGELKYYDAVGSKTVATVGGALGTPSFTALNMPSSNADPATTAGQIRHDSTDSNAASDGSIKVFTGNHVNTLVSATAVADDSYTIITKTEYIPIAYAENGAAAPAAASVWADTRKAKIRVFAADADDDVEIHWMVPDDYVGGIKFRVVGFVDNATAPADTETVIFNLAGCSVGNSDDGGCTLGTGVDSTFTADATYAQHDRWSSAWSNEITVTNIVAGESAMLKLFRDVDDTYGQGIGVAGIEIKYKARVLMADRY